MSGDAGTVVFRADSGVAIGTGHLVRCLALARELRARGRGVHFVCRDHVGHASHQVADAGFALTLLAPATSATGGDGGAHAAWLGAGWEQDAAETVAALPTPRPALLVVDHYAIDARWERRLRPHVDRLAAIDDLADRPHDCDVLVDHNPGRAAEDYAPWLPAAAVALVGPRFALLRTAFAAPATSRAPPAPDRPLRLLVSLGGIDLPDATGRILAALAAAPAGCLPAMELAVLMGANAPALAVVRRAAAGSPWPCTVHVDADAAAVAGMMDRADLAIGAGGTSALERCARGLPALVFATADNQVATAEALDRAGAAVYLGGVAELATVDLAAIVAALLVVPRQLARLGEAARRVTDGGGCARIADVLFPVEVQLRPATIEDAAQAYAWRNHPETRRHFFDPAPLAADAHLAWWRGALADPRRRLLIGEVDGAAFGVLRYDLEGDVATVSVYLDPARHGRGLGRALIDAGTTHVRRAHPDIRVLRAEVLPANPASTAAFQAAGYVVRNLVLQRPAGAGA